MLKKTLLASTLITILAPSVYAANTEASEPQTDLAQNSLFNTSLVMDGVERRMDSARDQDANGLNTWIDAESVNTSSGEVDSGTQVYTVGVDQRLSNGAIIGFAYSNINGDQSGEAGNNDSEQNTLSLYGVVPITENDFIEASINYADSGYTLANANSANDGTTFGSRIAIAHKFELGGEAGSITTKLIGSYSNYDMDSINLEDGSQYAADNSDRTEVGAGIYYGNEFELKNGIKVAPEVSAQYLYDLSGHEMGATIIDPEANSDFYPGEDSNGVAIGTIKVNFEKNKWSGNVYTNYYSEGETDGWGFGFALNHSL